jgi:4-hydroxybenzoyl-CoA thioesterase
VNQKVVSEQGEAANHHNKTFTFDVRVYIEDTDAGGIVYYVNYLKFMERCRTEFFRSLGYHKAAILDDGLLFVVHAAQIDYQRSARLDDALCVTAQVVKLARTYVEFEQTVERNRLEGNSEILCRAMVRIACVNSASMRPSVIPAEMHQRLESRST